jgi:hypothetical protein
MLTVHGAGLPPWRPGFDPSWGDVGFVVDKVALGKIFSEYFGFPCQLSYQQLIHIHWSSYRRCYIVSILRASLNKELTKKDSWKSNNAALYNPNRKIYHLGNDHGFRLHIRICKTVVVKSAPSMERFLDPCIWALKDTECLLWDQRCVTQGATSGIFKRTKQASGWVCLQRMKSAPSPRPLGTSIVQNINNLGDEEWWRPYKS